jgi:D-alanine-D-alanine ligase
MRVAVTYNMKRGESDESQEPPGSRSDRQAEWDAPETVAAVIGALQERHEVIPIDAAEDVYSALKSCRPEIVFNMAEGSFGPCREGHVPSILEYLNIPYTASDPLTLNLCLDKARAKEILSHYGLRTPKFRIMEAAVGDHDGVLCPAMVKPLFEGSSMGIRNNSLVKSPAEMQERIHWVVCEYNQPALVEEYLPGREFTVAILGNGKGARVLPIVEIKFDSLPSGVNPIYSYEAKWIWDTAANPLEIFECPASLSPHLLMEIEKLCLEAYRILRCRDWCRIDVRLDAEGKPNIIELNPLPGILPKPEDNSCFPKAARAAGLSYNQLINSVVDIACERYGIA